MTKLFLLFAMASALVGFQTVSAQSLGGFGNTGLSNTSAFGSTAQSTNGGQTTGLTSIGNSTLGGFDPTFGANQFGGGLTAGLGAATALGRSNAGLGLSGLGGFGGLGGGFGLGGIGGGFGRGRTGFNSQTGSQNEPVVRAVVRLGFDYSGVPSTVASTQINARLDRLPVPANLAGVTVALEGKTAVLSGSVESMADASLVERLVLLEPGVYEVRNELLVTGDSEPVVPQPIETTR